jgi:hypothetical protein
MARQSKLTNSKDILEMVQKISDGYIDNEELDSFLQNKVDKVDGKDLVDVNEINRLANVDNYDDSEVRELIDDKADINKVEQVNSKVDLVASKVEGYTMIEESDIDLIIADLDNE